jgi:hypothetical protein
VSKRRAVFGGADGLQERSTKDATAVKLLTVITLIYLPVTVVAVSYRLHSHLNYTNAHRTFSQAN